MSITSTCDLVLIYITMVNERDAYKIIGHIPVFNFFTSGIRAAVYAGQGNMAEVNRSGIGMIPFAHNSREAGAAAIEKLKDSAVKAAQNGVKALLAPVIQFCKDNAWWIAGSLRWL